MKQLTTVTKRDHAMAMKILQTNEITNEQRNVLNIITICYAQNIPTTADNIKLLDDLEGVKK